MGLGLDDCAVGKRVRLLRGEAELKSAIEKHPKLKATEHLKYAGCIGIISAVAQDDGTVQFESIARDPVRRMWLTPSALDEASPEEWRKIYQELQDLEQNALKRWWKQKK
jgi:hypothetical protein